MPTPAGPATLEGRHVRLEALDWRHLDALAEVGLDPELWRWTNVQVLTPEAMRGWLSDALQARERGTDLPFATVERESGRVVGSTRFMNVDAGHRRVEIGSTWIAPAWQRTAVNTEAKLLMLRHAFEALGCIRVELKTDALNARSRAAISRLGAVEEGTLRHHMITSAGRLRDTVYYSILEPEWPAVRARLEAALEPKVKSEESAPPRPRLDGRRASDRNPKGGDGHVRLVAGSGRAATVVSLPPD